MSKKTITLCVALILALTLGLGGVNLGVRETYADIAATVLDYFGVKSSVKGTSVLGQIL